MSEAKENYYAWCDKMVFADEFPPIKYIKKLEQHNAELVEMIIEISSLYLAGDRNIIQKFNNILNKLQKEN